MVTLIAKEPITAEKAASTVCDMHPASNCRLLCRAVRLSRDVLRQNQVNSVIRNFAARAVGTRSGNMPFVLSIIVPTLNEAPGIVETLGRLSLLRQRGAEVIVADGGSTDGTPETAAPLADYVIVSTPGRASQMNAGAALASGNVLMFLHADTCLPERADQLIAAELAGGHAWGRFDVCIEGRHSMLGVVARMMNLRSRLSGVATGDQAIFVRAEAFNAVRGFPSLALMEDIAISKKLRAISLPACITERAITSGRRWERHGLWRTILLMWWLRLCYFLGADPARLARLYRREPD